MLIKFPLHKRLKILSLGAESAGCFALYDNGNIFLSEEYGDILDVNNFKVYKKAISKFVKTNKPDVILTDLHPSYNSTLLGNELADKLKVPHIQVQHHIAHVFSAIGDYALSRSSFSSFPTSVYAIASDGTGFGFDEKTWGGEIFRINTTTRNSKLFKAQGPTIERVGSLEEQTMIGADLAVKEPARMLIAILNNVLPKDGVYEHVERCYNRNEFEILHNQLLQNFNCQKTTSTGRILDAVSVLLGFADNERNYKHEATKKLENMSTTPYANLESKIMIRESRMALDTTYLFAYLLKNIHKDKNRLAATAQCYIAKGFYDMILNHDSKFIIPNSYFLAGGMANNKLISAYLENKGVYASKTIPRGDEGLPFGQIAYYLFTSDNVLIK